MARVLLGVTGGIAAYKSCELTRLLVRAGHEVTPVLTPGAEAFVAAQTFEALARREQPRQLYPHLVDADVLVVAPLTANTLAKLAHGLADNVLTQLALAFRGPVLAAPAMNVRMWEHAATQANVAVLRDRGVVLIGPEEGELAEGEAGLGRMSEPEAIFARCRELLGETDTLNGRTRSRQRRGDSRTARRGAIRRQPLVRPHGCRPRRGGAQTRRPRDAPRRESGRACSGRGRRGGDSDRGRPRAGGEIARSLPTSS